MTFKEWWSHNGAGYEKLGVTESIAKSIWEASCDNLGFQFIKEFS